MGEYDTGIPPTSLGMYSNASTFRASSAYFSTHISSQGKKKALALAGCHWQLRQIISPFDKTSTDWNIMILTECPSISHTLISYDRSMPMHSIDLPEPGINKHLPGHQGRSCSHGSRHGT
jgi:hypothetical protein